MRVGVLSAPALVMFALVIGCEIYSTEQGGGAPTVSGDGGTAFEALPGRNVADVIGIVGTARDVAQLPEPPTDDENEEDAGSDDLASAGDRPIDRVPDTAGDRPRDAGVGSSCDLLRQDCGPTLSCYRTASGPTCDRPGLTGESGSCTQDSDCVSNHVCVDALGGSGFCRGLCNTSQVGACGSRGLCQSLGLGGTVGYCAP